MKKLTVFILLVLCLSVICCVFCSAEETTESVAATESVVETDTESESDNSSDKSLTPMNKENIMTSLEVLAKGMVAIFAVIIIIIIVVKIMQSSITAMSRPPKDED